MRMLNCPGWFEALTEWLSEQHSPIVSELLPGVLARMHALGDKDWWILDSRVRQIGLLEAAVHIRPGVLAYKSALSAAEMCGRDSFGYKSTQKEWSAAILSATIALDGTLKSRTSDQTKKGYAQMQARRIVAETAEVALLPTQMSAALTLAGALDAAAAADTTESADSVRQAAAIRMIVRVFDAFEAVLRMRAPTPETGKER